jgi:hypothetical protein
MADDMEKNKQQGGQSGQQSGQSGQHGNQPGQSGQKGQSGQHGGQPEQQKKSRLVVETTSTVGAKSRPSVPGLLFSFHNSPSLASDWWTSLLCKRGSSFHWSRRVFSAELKEATPPLKTASNLCSAKVLILH